jgi:DNA (cytosine-5)-methyltransferase 1
MKHIGLFEGIGGFSLAAEMVGWETIAWCEINPFGQKVLGYHFPKAKKHYDIKTTDFSIYRGQCDILTGGFPCQPYSAAGKRLGTEDDRHLWPEMLRAVREIQPRYVVGENVRGLTNWNGGLVFDQVQSDLETEGYEVLPFLLPACAVNAPHRRDRIWFIAYSIGAGTRCKSGTTDNEGRGTSENWGESIRQIHGEAGTSGIDTTGTNGIAKNTDSIRWTGNERKEEPGKRKQRQFSTGNNERIPTDNDKTGTTPNATGIGERPRANSQGSNDKGGQQLEGAEQGGYGNDNGISWNDSHTERKGLQRRGGKWERLKQGYWDNWPQAEPTICGGNDGISRKLDGITFSKWREESLKAYGNAIVPQVALQIFKAIVECQNEMFNNGRKCGKGKK